MLIIFAGSGRPKAQAAYWASARDGQASGRTKTQEVRPPATTTTEPPKQKEVVFSRHDDVIPSVAFSPDGKRLASAGDNCVKVTDLETGKELLRLKNSRGMHYFSVAYSPDGRTLAFSPDGKWLAVATGPTPEDRECKRACPAFGEITLWETGGWKLARRLRGSSAPIRVLAFSQDGRSIAGGAGLMDGGRGTAVEDEFKCEVFLWDIIRLYESESVKLVGVLKPHGWPIFNQYAPTFGPIPVVVFRTSDNEKQFPDSDVDRQGSDVYHSINWGTSVRWRGRWPFHPGSLNSMALSPGGKTLAVGNVDGKIRLLTMK